MKRHEVQNDITGQNIARKITKLYDKALQDKASIT